MKGTSFVASCVAAHSEKWSTSTPTISSSSRWPSTAITLGARGGAGAGELAGVGVGVTVGVVVTEGPCAPAFLMFAAARLNRQIRKHPATLFCLIVFIISALNRQLFASGLFPSRVLEHCQATSHGARSCPAYFPRPSNTWTKVICFGIADKE